MEVWEGAWPLYLEEFLGRRRHGQQLGHGRYRVRVQKETRAILQSSGHHCWWERFRSGSVEYPRVTGHNQGRLLGGGFKKDWIGMGIRLGGDKKGVQF